MAEMTVRERYRDVMRFKPGVRTLYWEFGYWSETVTQWYGQGLRRGPYSLPPGLLAPGSMLHGDAFPFPYRLSNVNYRDFDAHSALAFDNGTVGIPLNWRHCPAFAEVLFEEDETTRKLINKEGVTIRERKARDSVPQHLAWPVHDRDSWEKIKEERFGPDIMARLPNHWSALATTYRDLDCPVGVVMDGFFSMPRELLGLVRQLTMYYDDPQLMHNINDHLSRVWLAVLEEVVAKVDLDFVYCWEDMSFKNGPLMSPRMFDAFVVPYYQRVTGFLRSHRVETIFVDTDGDCRSLIPGFLKAGVNGLYPFEVQAGMDVVEIRRKYPELLIQGGLDKNKVAEGREAIDRELDAKLPFMLSQGGYIPFCDHLVPPNVSWPNFQYYRERVRQYVESSGEAA
jgi:uroporphyrinogen-III decarboxylase